MKNYKKIGIGFFGLWIALGYIGLIAGPDSEKILATEWRKTEDFSSIYKIGKQGLSIGHLWHRRTEYYLNDRIFSRFFLLHLYSELCHRIGDSAFPRRVVLGKGDWLFSGDHHQGVVEKFLGIRKDVENSVYQKALLIKELQKLCENKKIAFLYILAPNKHTIYPENLPDWAKKSDKTNRPENRLEVLAKKNDLKLINLYNDLSEAKAEGRGLLYRMQDTHWNRYGAYRAFLPVLDALKQQDISIKIPPRQMEFHESFSKPNSGELGRMLLLSQERELPDAFDVWFHNVDKEQICSLFINGIVRKIRIFDEFDIIEEHRIENTRALNKKHLLFVCDSFGILLRPYLIHTFEKITVIHSDHLKQMDDLQRMIERVKPDAVVVEIVARKL